MSVKVIKNHLLPTFG